MPGAFCNIKSVPARSGEKTLQAAYLDSHLQGAGHIWPWAGGEWVLHCMPQGILIMHEGPAAAPPHPHTKKTLGEWPGWPVQAFLDSTLLSSPSMLKATYYCAEKEEWTGQAGCTRGSHPTCHEPSPIGLTGTSLHRLATPPRPGSRAG